MDYIRALTHMYTAITLWSDEVQEMDSNLATTRRGTFSAQSYEGYPHSYDLQGMAQDVRDAIDTAREALKCLISTMDDMAEYVDEIRAITEGAQRDAGDYD